MIGNSIFRNMTVKRRLVGLAIGAFGLTAAVACTGIEGLDAQAAEAIVQNVDSLSGEVTVEFKDGTTTTFNLADIDMETLSQLIGDASLQAGDAIEVELDGSNSVSAVTPQVANVEAMIVEVDTTANTMLVEASNGVQLLLTLTAQTKVELDDDEYGTVQGLLADMLVKVKYDTNTDEALKIEHDAHDEDDDEHEVKGVITAINADDHTVTVEDLNGVIETYAVLSDTEIKVHGHAQFADLEVGMLVKIEFELDSGAMSLREIEVKTEDDDNDDYMRGDEEDQHELKGTITAIDPDAHSITVEGLNGIEETYTANSSTEIEIGDDASFSDLEVGMQVKIEFETGSLVLEEVEVRTEDDDDDDHDDDEDEDDDHDEEDEDDDDDDD